MAHKPAPPPGVSFRREKIEADAGVSSSSMLLSGLDSMIRKPSALVRDEPPLPLSGGVRLSEADLPPREKLPPTKVTALKLPPTDSGSGHADKSLLLSPRAQMRKGNLSGLQMRDAPATALGKHVNYPLQSTSSAPPTAAASPKDFTHAVRVLNNAYHEITSTLVDIQDELIGIKDTNELRDRRATIRIVVTLKQILEPVPLHAKDRQETRMANHSKEVLLLVFYKNTEDSLWVIKQKLAHLNTALNTNPTHSMLISIGHVYRSVSQTLAMYDSKSMAKKGDARPKSADLTQNQHLMKLVPSMSSHHLSVTPPIARSTNSAPPSPTPPLGDSLRTSQSGESIHKPAQPTSLSSRLRHGRISSVTLVPRSPVGPTSPTRPLVPPPPSDFEIYKDEHGEDLIRAGTYSALVYLLTHPDFEQGFAGIQAFILVHRFQHTPGTLFNILETIYDEVVLKKFPEGLATCQLLARFFSVWVEFALMPEFLINRRTIPSWPLSLYDRLLLFIQKLERNGNVDDANSIKLACLRSYHSYRHEHRTRRKERVRLLLKHAYVVPVSLTDSSSADSTGSGSGNVEKLVQSLDRQANRGAPLSPSSSSDSLNISAFIKSGANPYPANGILTRLSPQTLAEQLTIKEMLLFRRITDRELVTYKTKAQPSVTFIGHMVSWFNIISHAVAGEILSCTQPDLRAEILSRFIDTGVVLKSQGNYNGLMEILAALNLLPVSRLLKTWPLVHHEKVAAFKELEAVMDSRSNFHNYRTAFASGTVKLPYMGIFSRDCVFLNEANSDLTLSQLWNWEKILLKGKQVYLYKRLQMETMLLFPEIDDVQVAFNGLVTPDVDELYNMSIHLEPRKDDPLLLLSPHSPTSPLQSPATGGTHSLVSSQSMQLSSSSLSASSTHALTSSQSHQV